MDDIKQGEPVMDGGQHSAKAPSDKRMIAALSYLGLLCLIPLLFAKDSAFAQEHAKQGLLIAVIFMALQVFAGTLWRMSFGGFLVSIVGFTLAIVSIIGIIKAAQGERFEIPYISDWARTLSKKFGM